MISILLDHLLQAKDLQIRDQAHNNLKDLMKRQK